MRAIPRQGKRSSGLDDPVAEAGRHCSRAVAHGVSVGAPPFSSSLEAIPLVINGRQLTAYSQDRTPGSQIDPSLKASNYCKQLTTDSNLSETSGLATVPPRSAESGAPQQEGC